MEQSMFRFCEGDNLVVDDRNKLPFEILDKIFAVCFDPKAIRESAFKPLGFFRLRIAVWL